MKPRRYPKKPTRKHLAVTPKLMDALLRSEARTADEIEEGRNANQA